MIDPELTVMYTGRRAHQLGLAALDLHMARQFVFRERL
jgi:hypothetical protein